MMLSKRMIVTIGMILILCPVMILGQSVYHEQRASLFELLPGDTADIIFLGNSITDGGNWSELFNNASVKNRGISADVTEGVLARLDVIVKHKPAKIFIMIGINDLANGASVIEIVQNYTKIIQVIRIDSPGTRCFIQSVLPVNPDMGKFSNHTNKSAEVSQLNWHLRRLATQNDCIFIDLYSEFLAGGGKLNPEYTNDGLHLTGAGYLKWRDLLLPYMTD